MLKSKLFIFACFLGLTQGLSAQVVVQSLTDMSVGTRGVATSFSTGVWGKNPKADVVIRQIQEMGKIPLSGAEKEIFRQVLLTDVGAVPALEEKQEAFFLARLEALYQQHLYDDILTLMTGIPESDKTNKMKQFETRALFALGKTKEACRDDLVSAFESDEPYVQVACAYRLKSREEAGLAYDIYREMGGKHVLMNLVGDALFRNMKADLPKNVEADIFEEEMGLEAYGDDWINRIPVTQVSPSGNVLEKLKAYALAREELMRELPSALQQKLLK